MAKISDYLKKQFGSFVIIDYINSDTEADTFLCVDTRAGLAYVLRLDSHDEDNWCGAPRVPPRNTSVELANAQNTWLLNPSMWAENVEGRRSSSNYKTIAPDLYGVLDDRYLTPVGTGVRVWKAVNVDRIVREVPPDAVRTSLVWREICGGIVGETELVWGT